MRALDTGLLPYSEGKARKSGCIVETARHRVREAVLCPVLMSNDVPRFGSKLRLPCSTPTIGGESLPLFCVGLNRIDVDPVLEIIFVGAMVGYNEYLNTGGSCRRNQLARSHSYAGQTR
jgi:hypothetical protein